MKKFTGGAFTFMGHKPSNSHSDIRRADVGGGIERWPPPKYDDRRFESDNSVLVTSPTDKRSKQPIRQKRPWMSIQDERPSRSSTPSPAERGAARSSQRPPISSSVSNKSRNSSLDSIRASARKKLSRLFSGSARAENTLSASVGAVNGRTSEENFLAPYYVRRLLAEEERRNGQPPVTLAASDQSSTRDAVNTDEGPIPKARLAEPESMTISDDSEKEDIPAPASVEPSPKRESVDLIKRLFSTGPAPEPTKPDEGPTSALEPKVPAPVPTKAPVPEAPLRQFQAPKPRKTEKKTGGFFRVFRRRIGSILPASSGGGSAEKRKGSQSSTTSSSKDTDAMRSALYNVAAFGMAACCIMGAFAAYHLFYDFVKPAMWAVILGIVLYPLKRRVTMVVRAWLDHLSVSGTPLMLGVVALPLHITNGWGEFLLDSVTNNLKTVLLMVAAFPASALLLHFETIPRILVTTKHALLIIDHGVGIFKAAWVPVALLVYIFYVCLCNVFGRLRSSILCRPIVSWTVWTAGLAHLCSHFGPLRTLLFSLILILCSTYYTPFIQGLPSPARLLPVRGARPSKRHSTTVTQASLKPERLGQKSPKQESHVAPELGSPQDEPLLRPDLTVTVVKEHQIATGGGETADVGAANGSESNLYLKRLFTACFFVYISLHLWMMLLLTIPIGVALIRRLAIMFDLYGIIQGQWSRLRSALGDDTSLILPPPLVHFLRVLVHIDRQIIYYLRESMDFVGSLTAMLLLVIGVASVAGFVLFQLYHESIHVVHLSASIANQTLEENPALRKWLHETVQVDSTTELAEQVSARAVTIARTWLSQQIHEIVESDPEKASVLEAQIVSALDTLFERWWQKKETNETALQQQKTAIAQWADTWTAIRGGSANDLDWNFLDSLQEYLSVAWSVADSAWLIIKNNMEVLMIALTQIGSTLVSSGSAVIDFCLDLIVFLTFLLYVLSQSDDEYKPLRMIRDFMPGGRDTASTVTEQVEEAVNGVFFATSKIAIFYGMLTWLTHTLFAVNLVFIPSVLAALFAAIPFFGAYLVALPAVLELWVIRGEPFLAVLLFLLHYAPSYVVDDAIYSDITLTTPLLSGMAIAGGILWWGLEGAIFGPLVLCFILVLGGVYKKICFQTMSVSSAPSTPASILSRAGSMVMVEAHRTRLEENNKRPNGDVPVL